MMNFDEKIFEVRQKRKFPFLASHRGVNGANIPCNSLAAYKIAVSQGADVVEIDVSKTKDGKFVIFHPGMEPVFLKTETPVSEMTEQEVRALPLRNCNSHPTSYRVPTLSETLAFLKGRAYINVDKFWTDVKGITEEIRKAGVEKQVIVKTYDDEESLALVEKYASDLMFVPMIRKTDTITEKLLKRKINLVGVEVLFDDEKDEVISDEYIQKMHDKGILIWANGIVYNEKTVISAYHTDDISLTTDPERGWGWLLDKKIDFLQTDWLLAVKAYLKTRK